MSLKSKIRNSYKIYSYINKNIFPMKNILKFVNILIIIVLFSLQGHSQNTFLGDEQIGSAGANSSGAFNVFIGSETGGNVGGDNNTFLGAFSGVSLDGNENILLGSYNDEGYVNNAIVIGNGNSLFGLDNQLLIGNNNTHLIWGDFLTGEILLGRYFNITGSGNVGIGIAGRTDSYKLSVGGPIHMNNNSINYVTQLHFNDNVRFYDEGNDSYLNFKYGDMGAGGIKFYDGNGTRQGYIYSDGNATNPSFGLLDGDGNWTVHTRKDDYVRFLVNNSEKMRINTSGNIGIGTALPGYKLEVYNGQIAIRKASASTNHFSNAALHIRNTNVIDNGGLASIALGTSSANNYGYTINAIRTSSGQGSLDFRYHSNSTEGVSRMTIDQIGNVGIGTTTIPTGYKLAVAGKILAEEIQVSASGTSPWPDFVFSSTYNLRTLTEVEQFINQNNHLPDVPNAKEVDEKGIAIGAMNAILLQKIEELTLYMIEQEKRMTDLERENKTINKLINK